MIRVCRFKMFVVALLVTLAMKSGAFAETTVSAGLNVSSGNSDSTVANLGMTSSHSQGQHALRLAVEANYGESKVDRLKQTTADNTKVGLHYKYTFDRSFCYSESSLFRDELVDLDMRLILGAGAGYHLIKTDTAALDVELGGAYIREEFSDDRSDDSVAIRVAARHEQTIGEYANIWGAVEYLPESDQMDRYLLNSEAGVESVLSQSNQLSLRMVVQHRYDSDVPEGREKSDLAVISALVYKR